MTNKMQLDLFGEKIIKTCQTAMEMESTTEGKGQYLLQAYKGYFKVTLEVNYPVGHFVGHP